MAVRLAGGELVGPHHRQEAEGDHGVGAFSAENKFIKQFFTIRAGGAERIGDVIEDIQEASRVVFPLDQPTKLRANKDLVRIFDVEFLHAATVFAFEGTFCR